MQKFINNFGTTLTAAISTTGQLTMDISLSEATRLGALTAGDFYLLTLSSDSESNPGVADVEIVKVTAVDLITNPGRLTIVRGMEGSTTQTWLSGATRVSALLTKDTILALQAGGQRILTVTVASFTIEKSHNGFMVICDSASAQQISLANDGDYVDSEDAIPSNFRVDIVQRGAGSVKVLVSGADDIESTLAGSPTTEVDASGVGALMSFVKVASDEWMAFGDIV
ncbi:MAG: hypothetical protein DRI46_09160 [Chloroflexi bacterium]|nr:MAG: hypothetical protein DRI46_09160 [Chloroflexota bacterium]